MPITKLHIEEFLQLAETNLLLDVRSPNEFAHAHIPQAVSLPLFTDEERKVVGTAYKQESKQKAIKHGLKYFGANMVQMVEAVEDLIAKRKDVSKNIVLVHCWRGGMRSAGVGWLLDLYGFKVYTLVGGYKAYRNWVLKQFDKEYNIHILGGLTGSGKTPLLYQVQKSGEKIIDLEAIANHKGSAFGGLDGVEQPTAEMFENMLAMELFKASLDDKVIWIENESQRIGNINMPSSFFKNIRTKPVFFLDIPFEERLNHIVEGYGKHKKEALINTIVRIKKRLGGLETKNAINFLLENNVKECFRILLSYYDKWYMKSTLDRESLEQLITTIHADKVDAVANANKLLNHARR
jgi:tRNA 2-selenouridine synthase